MQCSTRKKLWGLKTNFLGGRANKNLGREFFLARGGVKRFCGGEAKIRGGVAKKLGTMPSNFKSPDNALAVVSAAVGGNKIKVRKNNTHALKFTTNHLNSHQVFWYFL